MEVGGIKMKICIFFCKKTKVEGREEKDLCFDIGGVRFDKLKRRLKMKN
jgi:hypothetical protein